MAHVSPRMIARRDAAEHCFRLFAETSLGEHRIGTLYNVRGHWRFATSDEELRDWAARCLGRDARNFGRALDLVGALAAIRRAYEGMLSDLRDEAAAEHRAEFAWLRAAEDCAEARADLDRAFA